MQALWLRTALLTVLLSGLFLSASFARAAQSSREETCGAIEGRTWKRSPWHYVDIWQDIGDFPKLKSISIDVDVDGDFTADGAGKLMYIAPLYGKIAGSGFYFGMQTDVSRPGKPIRGFLFSRWGRARSDDAEPAPGGWHSALTHEQSREGDFVGVRLAYPWGAGRYTFRLEPIAQDNVGTWINLQIHDHQTDQRIDAGSLRFPGSDLTLDKDFVNFVELYGGGVIDNICRTAMPATGTVRFGPLDVNGRTVDPKMGRCTFPKDVPPLAAVTRSASGIKVVFGRSVTGDRCGGR